MSFCLGGFIDPQLLHSRVVLLLTGCLRIVVHHPPELVVIHVDDSGHPIDRHLPYQGHGKGLKEKGEIRSFTRPWHIDLEYPVVGTVNSRDPHYQIAGILEETEMSPFLLGSVVGFHRFSADGAGKHASPREIDEDSYDPFAFIKLHLRNHPWRFQLE